MEESKLKIKEVPPRKIVAYKSKTSSSVYVPRTIKEGGGYYDEWGSFYQKDYSTIPQSAWDENFTPLCEGSTIEITTTTTKEIKL